MCKDALCAPICFKMCKGFSLNSLAPRKTAQEDRHFYVTRGYKMFKLSSYKNENKRT